MPLIYDLTTRKKKSYQIKSLQLIGNTSKVLNRLIVMVCPLDKESVGHLGRGLRCPNGLNADVIVIVSFVRFDKVNNVFNPGSLQAELITKEQKVLTLCFIP